MGNGFLNSSRVSVEDSPRRRRSPAPGPRRRSSPPSRRRRTHRISQTESIDKVAKANDKDISKTFTKLCEGGAKFLGEVIGGKVPSALDIASTFIPELAGMFNPLLGAAVSILLSFLGGLFGGHSESIYDIILKKVGTMISKAILKDKMQHIKDKLLDYTDDSNFWLSVLSGASHHSDRKDYLRTFESQLNGIKREVFYQCWDNKDKGEDCQKWTDTGIIVTQIYFAHLHLQTIAHDAAENVHDHEVLHGLVNRWKQYGGEYVSHLTASQAAFKKYRLAHLKPPKFSFGGGWHGHAFVVEDGCDTFQDHDPLPACGIGIMQRDSTTCKRGIFAAGQEAQMETKIKNCWSAYNKKVIREADELLFQVHGLRNMVSKVKMFEQRSDVMLIV